MADKISLRDVPRYWQARKPFDANGTLRGERCPDGWSHSYHGRLSGDDLQALRDSEGRIAYIVCSYATPIAWVMRDGTEYKVKQRFSVTTSRHMRRLY